LYIFAHINNSLLMTKGSLIIAVFSIAVFTNCGNSPKQPTSYQGMTTQDSSAATTYNTNASSSNNNFNHPTVKNDNGASNVTHLTDLTFQEDDEVKSLFAYKDGNIFTGEAWSSDGETFMVEVEKGVVTQETLYHANGKAAYIISENAKYCYNEKGEPISEQEFKEKYPLLVKQVMAIVHEMKGLNP